MSSAKDTEVNYTVLRVKKLLKDRGWTIYKLAKETGLAYSTIVNPMKRNTAYPVPTIEKICVALGITVADFLEGRREVEYTGAVLSYDEQNVVELYRRLSKKNKTLVLGFIQGLLAK